MLPTKSASGATGIEQWRQRGIAVFRKMTPLVVAELDSLQERARTPPPADIDEGAATTREKKLFELELKNHYTRGLEVTRQRDLIAKSS